ncbi:hypothetical protein ACFQHV_06575 [Promicromonospora thailandica]|uniref:Guanylate kinase n=1 Tax=Promicromonospora thailandica TaxID=765201 RepID=A0A9X2GB29_9MICO|nr:hypothetical protein [Promicromonospora thailandica]MCP2266394.1 guanylate kinase [Promicromonospora thailandica]BFF20073.1 hypothetical protein GCM10025730_35940 [Promicromonospora thailandica]
MSTAGVILYGPPAAGKDTVTHALADLSPAYLHYQRIKVGTGRRKGYRFVTATTLDQMRGDGQVIWENRAYGAVYAIDAPSIASALESGIPIVHVGQPGAVTALTHATPGARWVSVDLWCPRETAAERLVGRGSTDIADRLAVWDSTPHLAEATIAIDTATTGPAEAAQIIHEAVQMRSQAPIKRQSCVDGSTSSTYP